ncbi:MAG: transposase family protein [Rhodococcus sp.]|nr:transposase family protein [Rhodococcus sp. (in: high G+C Gram-positive bacteria)]
MRDSYAIMRERNPLSSTPTRSSTPHPACRWHDKRSSPQEILDAFDQLPDPRKARGTRRALTSVLATAAAAAIAGATSVAAIAE